MPFSANKSTIRKKRILSRLLQGSILIAVLWVGFVWVGQTLCDIAIGQIGELTNTKVETESVDFSFNGSVLIKYLVIRPHQKRSYDNSILRADTVYARFGIISMLMLRPRLKVITVDGFTFNTQYNSDSKQWNITAFGLKPPKGGSGRIPIVRLKSGLLQYSKVSEGQVKIATETPLDAKLEPAKKKEDGYLFELITAGRDAFRKSTLEGSWKPGMVIVTGGISSEDIPAFEKVWVVDILAAQLSYDKQRNYSLDLRIKDLLYTRKLAEEKLSSERKMFLQKIGVLAGLERFFDKYRPAGNIDLELRATGNLDNLKKSSLMGTVLCKDVSISNKDFPYLMENITGQVDFTESGSVLKGLSGRHNDVKLSFDGYSEGFGDERKYEFRIASENMALDEDLFDALNEKKKELWSAFSPKGSAAIEYHLKQTSPQDKQKVLAVELHNGDASYQHFPYPLKNLSGKLTFAPDNIIITNLISEAGQRKIVINGKVTNCNSSRPDYDISANATNIPLDPTLAASLTERQRRLYERYGLDGTADAEIKIYTPEQKDKAAEFVANVSLKGSSLKVKEFPERIRDISAKTVITSDSINIERLEGLYGQGPVLISGQIRPVAGTNEVEYCLSLRAEQAPVDENLVGMLPESLAKTIRQFQPEGTVNVNANINRTDSSIGGCPDYNITVECPGGQGLSVNLEQFPWPLDNVTGTLQITDSAIKLHDITATAAPNTPQNEGPAAVKIDGQITTTQNYPDNEEYLDFEGRIKFADYSFGDNSAITELNGTLRTRGLYRAGVGFHAGKAELLADSLRVKGKLLTGLRADVDYDKETGIWVAENLVADCYGGRLAGKFELKEQAGDDLVCLLQTGFEGIDLKKFLSDTAREGNSNNNYSSGTMNGSLCATVSVRNNYIQIGRCQLAIKDMQVGKMSPLAKVLAVLRLAGPEDYAFDEMLVDSYIQDNKVYFDKIDMSGNSLAFNGSGEMDLESQNINLVLTARGRRLATSEPSILQSLTDVLTGGVARLEVAGNYLDPQVTTTTFPVITDSLQILGTPAQKK